MYKEKKRRDSYWYTYPKGSFKENTMLFDFSLKIIMNVPELLPPENPSSPSGPCLSPTLGYRSEGFLKSEQSAEAAEAATTINCSY